MASLKKIKWKHYINYAVIAAFTVVFSILSFSGALKSSDVYLLEKIAIAIILAVSLSMVVGFLGELSLGHAGFMCVGAYLGGKTAVILEPILGEYDERDSKPVTARINKWGSVKIRDYYCHWWDGKPENFDHLD